LLTRNRQRSGMADTFVRFGQITPDIELSVAAASRKQECGHEPSD